MPTHLIQGKKISDTTENGANFATVIQALQTTSLGYQEIKKISAEKRKVILEDIFKNESLAKTYMQNVPTADINEKKFQLEIDHFKSRFTKLFNIPISTLRPPLGSCLIYGSRSSVLLRLLPLITALLKGNAVLLLCNQEKNDLYIELVQNLIEAGIPEKALNLIVTRDTESLETLIEHPILKAIHFTGNSFEGAFLKKKPLPLFSKKIKIHFGGRNPTLFTYDADLSRLKEHLESAFDSNYCGEHRFNRWFVQDKNYESFINELNPLLEETCHKIKESKDKDYILSLQAQNKSLLQEKNWKTVNHLFINYDFNNCSPWHQQETLGNILTVTRFKNTTEAVKFANTTNYASAATVVTTSEDKSKEIGSLLNMPHVFYNTPPDMGAIPQILGQFECGFGNEVPDDLFFTY